MLSARSKPSWRRQGDVASVPGKRPVPVLHHSPHHNKQGSSIMSKHTMPTQTTVITWADGFGTWHAQVSAKATIMNNHFADVARAAIAGEIRLRDSHADLDRMSVVLRHRPTSYRGTYEAEYVESWPSDDADAAG